MSYNTKQKDLIFNIIKNQKQEFTVKDIYNELNKDVGLTTIYRLIDKLEKNNIISKSIGKDNITFYKYLEKCNHDIHFYLKCEECGYLEHIDCDCIVDLFSHIYKEHKFKPDKEKIIINGICKKCSKEVKIC